MSEIQNDLRGKYHKLIDKYDKKGQKAKVDNFLEIIRGLDIKKGAKVLEIGAGNGLFSHFLAVYYESRVDSSDQYEGAGAPIETFSINTSISKELMYDNVRVMKKDFWDLQTNGKFDFIFAVNVIHHIIETEKNLSEDPENYQKCLLVFRKIYDLLNDGGVFLMRDVEKVNMRKYYGIKTSTIFKLKQNNWEWIEVLKEAGFEVIKIRHLAPRIIRDLPLSHFLFSFRFISILWDSSYVIIARK